MSIEQIGKYKIVAKIGQGAMGVVYKAHDPILNRFVAIKTISGALGADDQFRKRFHREARSAAQLNHKNIVTVYEFAEERGMVYMAMELLEGADLKDLIAKKAIEGLDDKLHIVEQLCDGLAYAHAHGVVHRDLKPANVHVLQNGTIKIMDFGLARLGTSEMTRTGTVMGTPNYMSPEQVRGEKVDSRSDVFSLGAVMYEVLAGHKPFEAESMHSVLFQVLDHEPPPLRQWIPDLPPIVGQVVAKALAKDPALRYPNAGGMLTALRATRKVLSGTSPPAARTKSPVVDLEKTVLESPAVATLTSQARHEWAVTGATALDLAPVPESTAPETARPAPTVLEAPEPAEEEEAPRRSSSSWILGGAAVVLAAGAGGFLLWRSRVPSAPAAPAAEIVNEQEKILRQQLVAGQVELAQGELDNKNYAAAIAQADKVLGLDPGNAAAEAIKRKAEATLTELDNAAREARAAFARGDADGAARALRQVMAIDPAHPAAEELKSALNQHFRGQAEEARIAAQGARQGAESARARGQEDYVLGGRRFAAGEGLFGGGQFAEATQRYLEARDAFSRARRAAEAAAEAEAQKTPPPGPSTARVGVPSPANGGPTPAPAVVVAPPVAPIPTPTIVAALTTPTPVTLPAASPEPAIRRALAEYARAVETKDVSLFKTVWPGISAQQERSLRESFKAVKSQRVNLTIESIDVQGGSATVHLARADTVNGEAQPGRRQTFRLSERGGAWTIDSIGQ